VVSAATQAMIICDEDGALVVLVNGSGTDEGKRRSRQSFRKYLIFSPTSQPAMVSDSVEDIGVMR
jgi:hypothetical protein